MREGPVLSRPRELKRAEFDQLVANVQACFACQDMAYCHVLTDTNGPLEAEIMFIGEAPGRLGAAITGRPFTGDQSGRRFQRLLEAAAILREQVFVTNALLCNPLANGRNRSPRVSELRNCSRWLRAQVDLVQPRLVVALGVIALRALSLIEGHSHELQRDVGRALPWYGRTLVPLYHPSPRALRQRSASQQKADFAAIAALAADRHFLFDHPQDACYNSFPKRGLVKTA